MQLQWCWIHYQVQRANHIASHSHSPIPKIGDPTSNTSFFLSLVASHKLPLTMYSDQTLLPPPPLPSSPSRFNLPPIVSSAAFSTATLPRLAYTTGPNPHNVPHDDKAERWQLPPLPSLTPFHNSSGASSSPGNHNVPPTRLPEQQQQQHHHHHQPRQRLQPPPPPSPPQLPAQSPFTSSSSSSIWRINPVSDYEIHHHHHHHSGAGAGATLPVSSDLPPTTVSPKHYQAAAVPESPQYYAPSFGRKQGINTSCTQML